MSQAILDEEADSYRSGIYDAANSALTRPYELTLVVSSYPQEIYDQEWNGRRFIDSLYRYDIEE